MFKEFRSFLARGNVLDLAVAVIMGAAFGTVIKSLVDDIIMPPIGKLLGGINFADFFLNLSGQPYDSLKAAQEAGAATINYGLFFNTLVNFVIIAAAMFLIVKAANTLQKTKEETTSLPEPSREELLLSEIRDLLKQQIDKG